MSSSGEKGGPDACGILANLWQFIQSVMDDSEPALEALGLSPKAFFLLEAVGEHPFPAELGFPHDFYANEFVRGMVYAGSRDKIDV